MKEPVSNFAVVEFVLKLITLVGLFIIGGMADKDLGQLDALLKAYLAAGR